MTIIDRVIFLDIDGVLNSEEYFIKRQKNWSGEFKFSYDLDTIAVERLNRIIENTKVEIVLSSSWRLSPLNEVLNALRYKGFKHDISHVTTLIHMDRGLQILKFIEENDVNDYLVIDDDSFDIGKYIPKEQFIHTRWETGLMDKNVEDIIKYFNKNKKEIIS